jgi:TonB family protein
MNRRTIILFFSLVTAAPLLHAQGLDEALKQYNGKVLLLRHPLQINSQQYDSAGQPMTNAADAPWTVYSGVLIEKTKLTSDSLRIDGRRVLFLFMNGQFETMDYQLIKNRKAPPFAPEVKLEIQASNVHEAAEANAALGRVFAMNTADLLDSVPEFWREYLRDRLTYDPSTQRAQEFRWHEPAPTRTGLQPLHTGLQPSTAGIEIRTDDDQNIKAIYHVGAEVKAPRPLSTPEPEFSQAARYEKFQGVVVVKLVVAKDGSVHYVQLVRPRGLGLDEQAEARIKTWRFSPATRNGEPVSVEMNVEVSFNLY